MKKPRVEDFDPKAVPTLGSPIDTYPKIERPRTDIQSLQPPEKHLVSAPLAPVETPVDGIPRNTSPSPTQETDTRLEKSTTQKGQDAGLPANQQTSKPVSPHGSLPANQQGSKPVYLQTGIPANLQTSKPTKKFSSYLTEGSIRALKRLALDEDKKDYEVLQEALDEHLHKKGYDAS